MTKLWFRARRYGWGWTPATIEGWCVLAAFFAAMSLNTVLFFHRLRSGAELRSALVTFYLGMACLVILLVWICWKTGERPRWRWGN